MHRMELGTSVTKRLPNNGDLVDVILTGINTHTEFNEFNGEVRWRAYLLDFKPKDGMILPFTVREYLTDNLDDSFQTINPHFRQFIDRCNNFALKKYGVDRYDSKYLVNAEFTVKVNYDRNLRPSFELVKINEIPALNKSNGTNGIGFMGAGND